MVPQFIVGGGVRCATGWIRACLSEHPTIYMQPKETHYFDQSYERGSVWYNEFFTDHDGKEIVGEKTASYLHDPSVAERIHRSFPDVKLVFCLRDPVERMYSHYSMLASDNEELQRLGFLGSIESDQKFSEWGKYYTQLKRFIEFFPREKILIKIYEDKDRDPYSFMSDIYCFVGADPDYQAPSTIVRTKLGQLEHNSMIWGSLSRIMLHPRAPFLLRSLYTDIRPDENRDILTDALYRQYAEYYREDLLELEQFLGRDLRIWRTRRFVID